MPPVAAQCPVFPHWALVFLQCLESVLVNCQRSWKSLNKALKSFAAFKRVAQLIAGPSWIDFLFSVQREHLVEKGKQ